MQRFGRLRRRVPWHLLETHSIPRFDGRQSRRHEDVSLWRLQLKGARLAWQRRDALAAADTLVQFAGFPRSGHSLIGSLIDAHPRARVAHELDIMGLLDRGVPMRSILALMDDAASEFTRHGRHWNGYCYYVEEAAHDGGTAPQVLGDKKGDMAVRRIAAKPSLLDRLARTTRGLDKKWICVLRNPFDNIATMSLRASRLYDTLRASSASGDEFRAALARAQAAGDLPRAPASDQIDEYERLCGAVESIRRATSENDWFELSHEAFSASPQAPLKELMTFLQLEADPAYIERCSALVHASGHRSSALLEWPAEQTARIEALIERYPFLHRYRGAAPA